MVDEVFLTSELPAGGSGVRADFIYLVVSIFACFFLLILHQQQQHTVMIITTISTTITADTTAIMMPSELEEIVEDEPGPPA